MGYNESGWYGSPPIAMGGGGIELPESERFGEILQRRIFGAL